MEVQLDSVEVRVLGVLIEKHLSTPDYYPMTPNALRQACNQKTNRDPVMDLGEGAVMGALESLQRKRLVGTVSGAGSRAVKYRHAVVEALRLATPELALLASLLLRGPQTVGELRGRTARMHAFETLEEVEAHLDALAERPDPLVTQLPLQPGRKEARHIHLLSGEPSAEMLEGGVASRGPQNLSQLEEEVARLREELDTLREAFDAFRAQFE